MHYLTQKEWLDKIPAMEQRQDSTLDQMNDLIAAANKLGLYDAVDWIKDNFPAYKKN